MGPWSKRDRLRVPPPLPSLAGRRQPATPRACKLGCRVAAPVRQPASPLADGLVDLRALRRSGRLGTTCHYFTGHGTGHGPVAREAVCPAQQEEPPPAAPTSPYELAGSGIPCPPLILPRSTPPSPPYPTPPTPSHPTYPAPHHPTPLLFRGLTSSYRTSCHPVCIDDDVARHAQVGYAGNRFEVLK